MATQSGRKKRKNFPNYYLLKLVQSSTIIVSFVSGFVYRFDHYLNFFLLNFKQTISLILQAAFTCKTCIQFHR